MLKITFIAPDGAKYVVDAAVGDTLMEAAVRHGVPGIEAICGGGCICGTCQIYISPDDAPKFRPANMMELDTLEVAKSTTPESRLSCQIRATEKLDGIEVRVPEVQV